MTNRSALPRFSILTVTFNAEAYIERTLQSVACQTYTHFDYHIIDGASSDRTLELCEPYADILTDVLSEPDKGLYDAMNKAIRRAQGDYLIFLNAGDRLKDATVLQRVAEQIQQGGEEWPDVVYGNTEIVDNDQHFVRMRRLSPPEILTWKSFRQGMLVCHQAFWARRDLALQIQYDLNYRYSSDFDWCIRVLRCAKHTLYVHSTLISYLEGGMSTRNHRKSLMERLRIMVLHYGWLKTLAMHIWFAFRALIKW